MDRQWRTGIPLAAVALALLCAVPDGTIAAERVVIVESFTATW